MLTPLRYNGWILTEPRSVAVQDLIQRLLNPNVQHRSELSDFGVLFAARRILNIHDEQQLSSEFLRQDKSARQIVYISTSSVRTCIPQFNFRSLFTKPIESCSKKTSCRWVDNENTSPSNRGSCAKGKDEDDYIRLYFKEH